MAHHSTNGDPCGSTLNSERAAVQGALLSRLWEARSIAVRLNDQLLIYLLDMALLRTRNPSAGSYDEPH
ncbi:hypothetical protein [Enterovirga sp.]|uniref:hypothetical protein n=1 Tax=Enterovirga sp. TaxID=2026350 RepID=UPI0026207FF0|nr:hypothetical protein [Enterovirga sp.]MDB5591351.1 hypothetical protein [Enterovirga sp.]